MTNDGVFALHFVPIFEAYPLIKAEYLYDDIEYVENTHKTSI